MNELPLLCKRNVYFTFDGCVYLQNGGFTMGSPLCPILAGVIIVEVETKVVPTIDDYSLNWK